jgi:hypothetical protein
MQRHNIGAPRDQMLYRSSGLHYLAEFGDTYLISIARRSRHITYFQQLDWLTKILS